MKKNYILFILVMLAIKPFAQNINCNLYCITAISIDTTTVNHILNVTVYSDDSVQVNYPVVIVTDAAGDTVGNIAGSFFLFAQLPHSTVIHHIPTTLDSLPASFTSTVYFTDYPTNTTCSFAYPMTCSVGIAEISSPTGNIHLFPNPAQDAVNISFTNNKQYNVTVSIYNSLGQKINTTTTDKTLLSLSTQDFENGLYTVKINTEENIYTGKFVVVHQ